MTRVEATQDPPQRSWSLRLRLLTLLFAVIVLATAVQAWISYRTALAAADAMFDYQMQQMAFALRSSSGAPLIGPADAPDEVEDFAFVVNIRDRQGRMVFSNGPVTLPSSPSTGYSSAYVGHEDYRVYTYMGPRTRVQVAQEVESRSELSADLAVRSLWPMLALSAAILLSVYLVITQALGPLTRLREQIVQRQPDDLSPLPQVGLPDEILPVVADINALIARMQGAYEAQHRFVSDAAHELRTPLAAVQLQSDAVRRAVTADQRETALNRQREGIARATHLVDQLLTLARRDARAHSTKGELLSLFEVVRESVLERDSLARQKDIDIAVEIGEAATVSVPAELMRSVVGNLIDNAIKYTPAAGRIWVHVELDFGRLRISVEDSGPGIPPEERARVTDRFYRVPGSPAYGSGLGLSIVERAVEAIGGRLELGESRALGGLHASCYLPCSNSRVVLRSA